MKSRNILLIVFCYLLLGWNETGLSIGTTQIDAIEFGAVKTKDCKTKGPATIFSMLKESSCEFYSTVVKPIQKCYDMYGSNSLKGFQCVTGLNEELKYFTKPKICDTQELEDAEAITCNSWDSLQKVIGCTNDKAVGESRTCLKNTIVNYYKQIQATGNSIFSKVRDNIKGIPDFDALAAAGGRDPIFKVYNAPSPNALAIKDIRSQIDSYTGSGFLAKIEQGVKSDAIEQRKMEEERIERERQERIAREEQQRQQRLADLENQKRQMENEYYQMKSTGLKTPSKCQQAKAEYAQAEANMRQAANFSRGMGSFATGDAANAWNNTANAFDAGANVAETLKNAISIGCVMAGEGDFVDMANAIGNLNNSIQTLKSSSNSGSTYSAPSNPTSSAPDRCHCTLKRGNGISMDLGYINRSACTSSDVVTAICN